MNSLKITALRVSTMTVTGHLQTKINLMNLWNNVPYLPYWYLGEGILKMDYNMDKKGTCKSDILLRRKKPKKKFFNQATLVVRIITGESSWKEVNIKLFSNGGLQMTGILSEEMGLAAINVLLKALKDNLTDDTLSTIFTTPPELTRYSVQLVNSDYSVGVPLRRDKFHKILVQKYKLFSTFESDIYQGINTKYFVNAQRPVNVPQGSCGCPTLCAGSGDGFTLGNCKTVTIAPFQTGKLIITGARTLAQINEAYEFINQIIRTHAEEIIRPLPPVRPIQSEKVSTKKQDTTKLISHPTPRHVQAFATSLIRN